MKIGIGLPTAIPGVKGELILDWAKQADSAAFSSLGVTDRVVYQNYEPLITLAAVAGVTKRIRLMTTVLLAPLRRTALLAKQAASLDAISNGRLTLGLGIGVREDDFLAAEASFSDRGKRFEQQLALMTQIWSGERVSGTIGEIGPVPVQQGGPELLIGAYSPKGRARIARWGNGALIGVAGGGPEMVRQSLEMTRKVWQEAGRTGKPRLVVTSYYGLGQGVADWVNRTVLDYYAPLGPLATQVAAGVPTTPEALRGLVQAFADMGVDELLLWPCIPELDQISRLEDAISKVPH
jgi:alkanesulfonate monooxygenase SsuD/methylene tetrahydromethanopterin reductase-like flavin-dependent oxidoreductase (luciferase family)